MISSAIVSSRFPQNVAGRCREALAPGHPSCKQRDDAMFDSLKIPPTDSVDMRHVRGQIDHSGWAAR
jgi:hypothetical protein